MNMQDIGYYLYMQQQQEQKKKEQQEVNVKIKNDLEQMQTTTKPLQD